MSAIFLPPTEWTRVSATEQALAPASNANLDPVGLVWRTTGTSGYATLNVPGGVDTVALARTNLTANAQIRIRIGSTDTVTGGNSAPVDRTVSAWSGPPSMDGAYTLVPLEAVASGPIVRIDISDPTNTAGYLEVQRILAGRRVQCDGVDHGASQGFDDSSLIDDGPGYTTVDRYRVRPTWKFTVTDTTRLTYARDWYPLFMRLGDAGSLLFIPDTASPYMQTQATLARITGNAKGDSQSSDFWKLDLQLKAI